ncbi:unnamed protein product [Symbiodinium natans]|uniref:Transcription initiation factor TFIID subunit 12 domain-containing protein n=1 Tax=Symbiodinium natans TaxID=878477 RepID=A0A812R7C5_9DINO|nr:unnamed protein product [Symbiodinium natans]
MGELPSFVVEHYLRRGGCETSDPEILQIAADATESFVTRILREAQEISKSRRAQTAACDEQAAPDAPDNSAGKPSKRQRTAEEPPQDSSKNDGSILHLQDLLQALRRF